MRNGMSGKTTCRHAPGAAAWVSASAVALPAHAHGFGQRYDLPVPLWLYLAGAGATVAVSFLMMALFLRATPRLENYPRVDLLKWRIGRVLAHRYILSLCRVLAMALFVLILLAGFFGRQSVFKNIAPVMVWAIWWVGMAYVSALLGNLWALVNPLATAFAWAEAVYFRLRRGAALSLKLTYPERLGMWPAVALFFAFTWMELVSEHGDMPANLAAAVLLYAAITWCGMFLFGRDPWLRRGEAFSLVFGLLARFAPTEVRVVNAQVCAACVDPHCRGAEGCVNCYACFSRARKADREWNLRPYAAGLLSDRPVPPSMLMLILLMLAAVTFDGFIETPLWSSLVDWLGAGPPNASAPPLGGNSRALIYTFGLIVFPILLLAIYLAFSWLIAHIAAAGSSQAERDGRRYTAASLAGLFVVTLIPIAIAYHLAHYLSFLFMAGQYLIPLASDPFGYGWDLLGTARYFVRIGIIDARLVWYTSVAAIVIGHVAAVYLAHAMALRIFKDKQTALRSQYPMLALMVGYTMVSLWIIAQPVVSSRFG